MEQAVASHAKDCLQALLLGVTPAIVRMQWPERTSLLAVDNSTAMAQALWSRDVPRNRWVVCGHWLAMPRRDRSCDVVIGDGSMNCVRYPDDFRAVAAEVCRLLRDDGIFVSRCFLQPAVPERPEDVFADLFRTTIPSFHHFKFRLLLAMQRSTQEGIPVKDVYRFWASRNVDLDLLISRTGWERSAIETMELYRDQGTVHTFPTLPEWRSVLLEFFDEISLSTPSYNLGECCPTLVLRRRL